MSAGRHFRILMKHRRSRNRHIPLCGSFFRANSLHFGGGEDALLRDVITPHNTSSLWACRVVKLFEDSRGERLVESYGSSSHNAELDCSVLHLEKIAYGLQITCCTVVRRTEILNINDGVGFNLLPIRRPQMMLKKWYRPYRLYELLQ